MNIVKKMKKWGIGWNFLGYLAVAVAILGFVFLGSQEPREDESIVASINRLNNDNSMITVSALTEITLVANLAERARLPARTNAENLAFSLILQHTMAMGGDGLTGGGTLEVNLWRGVEEYTVAEGDNLEAIARRFNVTTQTIRWSNDMRNDNITPGQVLLIPSIDGFIHTVGAGETVEGLAERYQTSAALILLYNDLEITGLREGTRIVIPDGILPVNERPEFVPPVVAPPPQINNVPGGGRSQILRTYRNPFPFVDNSYAWGWCTWYAALRRYHIGRPIGRLWGNASSWAWSAARAGHRVDRNPEVGAIMANGGGFGGWGHVAIVEEVNWDEGWIIISEMNGPSGLWMIDWRKIPMSTALNGTFQFIH
jgi:surface antigen/LysM repeat protein